MAAQQSKIFYWFISIHTFLIGLFPFYIPVFLWKRGYSIAEISFFVALTGAGYILALWIWDRVRVAVNLKTVIRVSFSLELVLLITIFDGEGFGFPWTAAILYGIYNCFFWITNRVLFFKTISTRDSGKRFGNFQIIVAVILKIGVFSGGLLLDRQDFLWVFAVSALFAGLGLVVFSFDWPAIQLDKSLNLVKVIHLKNILRFKDRFRSRFIFAIDGFFLFLESYFWVISLFIIVKESFWRLGLLVIFLMVVFGLLFLMIKNRIDSLPQKRLYEVCVVFYIVSWFLRGWLDGEDNFPVTLIFLVLITFFTSLFRLSFNKRFFDLAITTSAQKYILLKSYYSQFFITVFFIVTGVLLRVLATSEQSFRYLFVVAGFIAVGYLAYRPDNPRR